MERFRVSFTVVVEAESAAEAAAYVDSANMGEHEFSYWVEPIGRPKEGDGFTVTREVREYEHVEVGAWHDSH